MDRILEPKIMDVPERAAAYGAADFSEVNGAFVERLLALAGSMGGGLLLDQGTGPGDIAMRIAAARPAWRVVGIDASWPMLSIARGACLAESKCGGGKGLQPLVLCDALCSPFADSRFDVVCSNSILHHLPDPEPFWREVRRIARPGALFFLRDLLRPETPEAAQALVDEHATDESPILKEDFYNSLRAAYTVEEVREQLKNAGLDEWKVTQISDRHLDVAGWKA